MGSCTHCLGSLLHGQVQQFKERKSASARIGLRAYSNNEYAEVGRWSRSVGLEVALL